MLESFVRCFLRRALLAEERLVADVSRTGYKYFRQWSERPGPQEESILEQVCWRGPTKQWTERADQLLWTPRASRTPTVPVVCFQPVDRGLPHAIHVTTADSYTDRLAMFEQNLRLPTWPRVTGYVSSAMN